MRTRTFRLVILAACLAFTASVMAQEGHPLKGSWRGDWGPTATHRNHIVIVMDWDGKTISGVVNPGPEAIPIKSAVLDITPGTPAQRAVEAEGNTPAQPAVPATPPIFKVRIEADAKDRAGNTVNFIGEGTIEDVGLPNRSIVGTWNHGNVRGDFRITRQ